MDAKHYALLGWIAAFVTFWVVNLALLAVGFGVQIFPGLIAAGVVKLLLQHRANKKTALTVQPQMKVYDLPKSIVQQVLKDTVPNINIEDRWWILHWQNNNKGEMKFRVNYELPGRNKAEKEKQQIVLDVYVQPIEGNARTSVRFIYTPSQGGDQQKSVAEDLITHTSEAIDYQLKIAEQGKM